MIERFRLAIPSLDMRHLASPELASYAVNAVTRSGSLCGLRQPKLEVKLSAPFGRAIRLKDPSDGTVLWVGLPAADDELITSPVVNDQFGRVYRFSRFEAPQVSTFAGLRRGDGFFPLAVPAPTQSPLAEVVTTSDNPLLHEVRAYVIAYVTEWGEESAVSPPAIVQGISATGSVKLTRLRSGDFNALSGRGWKCVRVYRTVTGVETVAYFFVADVPWGQNEFLDDLTNTRVALNRTLANVNDNLPFGYMGVRQHPSGALVAFKGNTLRLSVPYMPHAWPDDFALAFTDTIVAVEVFGQDLFVMTDGAFYTVYGPTPDNLGVAKYPGRFPCLNYRSVVATPEGVMFATADGVALANGGSPTIWSSSVVSRSQWRRAFSDVTSAVFHDGCYIATVGDQRGVLFDVRDGGTMTELELPVRVTLDADRYTGVTWALADANVFEWDPATGPVLPYRWRSKEFVTSLPQHISHVEVGFSPLESASVGVAPSGFTGALPDCPGEQVFVTVWADDVRVFHGPVYNEKPAPLPKTKPGKSWVIEVSGYCPVHHIRLRTRTETS